LRDVNFTDATWYGIRDWSIIELRKERLRLESTELSHEATQELRGSIRRLKALIALPPTR